MLYKDHKGGMGNLVSDATRKWMNTDKSVIRGMSETVLHHNPSVDRLEIDYNRQIPHEEEGEYRDNSPVIEQEWIRDDSLEMVNYG